MDSFYVAKLCEQVLGPAQIPPPASHGHNPWLGPPDLVGKSTPVALSCQLSLVWKETGSERSWGCFSSAQPCMHAFRLQWWLILPRVGSLGPGACPLSIVFPPPSLSVRGQQLGSPILQDHCSFLGTLTLLPELTSSNSVKHCK